MSDKLPWTKPALQQKGRTHHIVIKPVAVALSGRPRYRVECHTCKVVVHEATTGPLFPLQEHWNGQRGYERPMTEEEMALLETNDDKPHVMVQHPPRYINLPADKVEAMIAHWKHMAEVNRKRSDEALEKGDASEADFYHTYADAQRHCAGELEGLVLGVKRGPTAG